MTAETLQKVFDPYFTTKSSDKGSGLGLAMVYGFVQRSQGFIFVDSQPGEGTSVTFYLPRSSRQVKTQPARGPVADDATPSLGGSETILLVDDEDDILFTTRLGLEKLGYQVITSSSGDAALEILQQHRDDIDLLFTDILMPGNLNGFQLAEAALTLKPDLPVLFTTGYAKFGDSGGTGAWKQEWESAIIQKPYRRDELCRRIRDILDNGGDSVA